MNVPFVPQSEGSYLHYAENARTLDALAVIAQTSVNLVGDAEPQRLSALFVTHRYFDVLGRAPVMGRAFAAGEDETGAEPVAVLSYGLWRQTFGADPAVVGSVVELDGVSTRIVGVAPEGVSVLDEELWMPMQIDPAAPEVGSFGLIGVARLAEGQSVQAANVEMHELMLRYAAAHPDEFNAAVLEEAGLDADVKSLKEVFVQDVRPVLWVLLGTVGIVLLVACANVANLFLVRAEGRLREQAVRTAMGASRGDIVRQYLTESLTLALGAGLLGLAIAAVGIRGLLRIIPTDLPRALDVGPDGSVLVFTAGISLLSGVLFGVAPTMGYGRADLTTALKDGGRSATGGVQRIRTRSVLVVAQVALALVLLVGSGLMLRSFSAIRSTDIGFESDGVLTFSVGLPASEYRQADQVLDFHRRLADRLAALPGAGAVGVINGLPLTDTKSASPMEPVDRPVADDGLGPLVEQRQITPGYFAAMSIPLREGRALAWEDRGDGVRAVVVSETLAEAFWPGESALGRQIRNQSSENAWEVVGVVADVRFDGVEDDPLPIIYFPLVGGTVEGTQAPYDVDVVVRLAGDPLASVGGAREALRATDARLPMINPRSMASIVSESMASTSITVLLLGVASGIALLLGTVGIYGVIAYVVSRRTQEIGVRMALGAPASTVLRAVRGQGMALVVVGLAVGLLGAWALSRALASLLYGVSATDPLTYAGMAALLALVSLAAMYVPARRAARVDPVEALRSE
mgnify:FL=1